MIPYNVYLGTASAAITTTGGNTPNAAIVSGATRSFLVVEIDVEGMDTASASLQLTLSTYTGTLAGGTAITAVTPLAPNMTGTTPALAFSGTAFHNGASITGLTIGVNKHVFGLNKNGQRYFWRANPNLNNAISVAGGAALNALGLFTLFGQGPLITGRIQLLEF